MEGVSKDTVIDMVAAEQPAIDIEQTLLVDTCQETEVQSTGAQPEPQTRAEIETQMKERDPTIPCDCGSKVTSPLVNNLTRCICDHLSRATKSTGSIVTHATGGFIHGTVTANDPNKC
jgi:hypothetical protein